MDQILINILSVVVTAVVIPLITLLGTKFIQFIGAKTHNEKAAQALANATTIVLNAVKTVFQTYVEALKKNGTFDQKAQVEALTKARDLALKQFSDELKGFITASYGDLNTWLTMQIEATINTLKN